MISIRAACGFLIAALLCVDAARGDRAQSASSYDELVRLFNEWRTFQQPRALDGVPDYSAAAMATQHGQLAGFQQRLKAIDPSTWPVPEQVDHHLVRAEMNGLDFDHRVLRPWARDPAFYVVVHAAQSDTPAHEGTWVHGAPELWTYAFPVSGDRLDALRLKLRAAPALLRQARTNLVGNARDLWSQGVRATREQSAVLSALAARLASLQPDLVPDVRRAQEAVDEFRAWLEAELPKKNGPSGIGVEHYDWYLKHVHLLPYTWQQQVTLIRRELERGHAALRLEEARNATLPRQMPISSAAEHRQRFNDAVTSYMKFLQDRRILTIQPYMDSALRARIGSFSASNRPREFFTEVDYRDPVVMRTHGFHWIDLARMERQPHASAIRRGPLLYNIWAERAEGLATAMEELMMQAGLFDAQPRSRELIHILLAQRGARAMGDLMMHANQWTLDEAVKFAVERTPRGWLRPDGTTVWFEQHLYLRQPAYGTSYVIGKLQIDRLIADRARQQGDAFTLRQFMDDFQAAGLIPVSLIRWQMTGVRDEVPE